MITTQCSSLAHCSTSMVVPSPTPRDANPAELPLTWQEALGFVADLRTQAWLDHSDWRLPNRRELRSLVSHQTRRPALPAGHPFSGVFPSWYWTSTSVTLAPSHAWHINLDGARTFFGGKDQGYWSSTTSMFEPDWAWALYTQNGGVGVGQKTGRHFHVWAVRDKAASALPKTN